MVSPKAQLAVVGGGLAATLLVRALASRGLRELIWVGPTGAASGSSVPCALVHPFAGRSFQPRHDLFAAWAASRAWLEALPPECKVHSASIRRAIDPGGRLLRSLAAHRDALRVGFGSELRLPEPVGDGRMLAYGPAFAVDLPAALSWCRRELAALAIAPRQDEVVRLEADDQGWCLHLRHGPPLRASEVVVAAGAGSRRLLEGLVDTRHLEHVEGALVHKRCPPLDHFAIDRGHVASTTDCVAWGTSYVSCDRPGPKDALTQLGEVETRLAAHQPSLPSLNPARVWSGVRVVDRLQRKPWVKTPRDGLHVFTAFGSQGVLWTPLLADRWASQWVAGA